MGSRTWALGGHGGVRVVPRGHGWSWVGHGFARLLFVADFFSVTGAGLDLVEADVSSLMWLNDLSAWIW